MLYSNPFVLFFSRAKAKGINQKSLGSSSIDCILALNSFLRYSLSLFSPSSFPSSLLCILMFFYSLGLNSSAIVQSGLAIFSLRKFDSSEMFLMTLLYKKSGIVYIFSLLRFLSKFLLARTIKVLNTYSLMQ